MREGPRPRQVDGEKRGTNCLGYRGEDAVRDARAESEIKVGDRQVTGEDGREYIRAEWAEDSPVS